MEWCGWPHGAEQAFRDALRLSPAFPSAHYRLGEALARQRRWLEASQAFADAVRLQPGERRAARQPRAGPRPRGALGQGGDRAGAPHGPPAPGGRALPAARGGAQAASPSRRGDPGVSLGGPTGAVAEHQTLLPRRGAPGPSRLAAGPCVVESGPAPVRRARGESAVGGGQPRSTGIPAPASRRPRLRARSPPRAPSLASPPGSMPGASAGNRLGNPSRTSSIARTASAPSCASTASPGPSRCPRPGRPVTVYRSAAAARERKRQGSASRRGRA